ncbi:MAG: hypothetical protein KBD90_05365, partial [Alphaproteobacteria bacterium]|nr:hypothetical protein [Alphaproteobacteria bacterium]
QSFLKLNGVFLHSYPPENKGLFHSYHTSKIILSIVRNQVTKCSLYTKQAKQDKAKDKKSTKDLCTEYNDACVEGKWLGMFKCRNKELQPSEDKDE